MIKLLLFIFIILINICVSGQTQFKQPWNNPENLIIIDAYSDNYLDWDEIKTNPRVVGLIHKATEGLSKYDNKYSERKQKALEIGYLFGSFHVKPGGKSY